VTGEAARAAVFFALVGAAASAGCFPGGVVRVTGGEERTGPFVRPDAYAAYARGALAEAEGRWSDAAAAYRMALDRQEDALIFARLGAVLCRQGMSSEARQAFDEGHDADSGAAIVFRERARCALQAKAYDEALDASARAMQLDPDDREALATRVEALERSQRGAEADALRAETAGPRARPTATVRGSVASSEVRPGGDLGQALREPVRALAEVDDALARGALDEASASASRARLPRSMLAARALAFGHIAFARKIAGRVAAADPRDGSARLIAAAGADLAHDEPELTKALASPEPALPPSYLARLLFAEVLLRREGPAAAMAMVDPTRLKEHREDPVEERVRVRVLAAMGRAAD